MSFVAISPFRPTARPHPLAAGPSAPGDNVQRAFEPPAPETIFANAIQQAVGRYVGTGIVLNKEIEGQWIKLATSWPGYETLSATLVVATLVLMLDQYAGPTPTPEDVRDWGPTVLSALTKEGDTALTERLLADLLRYSTKIQALRA